MRRGDGASRSNRRIVRPPSRICSPHASARPAAGCMPGARETIRCWQPCGSICAMRRRHCKDGALAVADALQALAVRHGDLELPGYTHMQQAMPSSVALWAWGFAAELQDDAEGLLSTQRRIGKNPLGSAAGFGTPNLDINREATRRRLGFCGHSRAGDRGAVVARQSRGAAAVRNHAAHAGSRPARGRPAAVLFARIRLREPAGGLHHRLLDHAAEAQSRCLRADARAQRRRARGAERGLEHHAKTDLGLSPRFAADQAAAVSRASIRVCRRWQSCRAHSTAYASGRKISGWIPSIHAAAAANALVAKEGIPFREAYRRVAAKLKDNE